MLQLPTVLDIILALLPAPPPSLLTLFLLQPPLPLLLLLLPSGGRPGAHNTHRRRVMQRRSVAVAIRQLCVQEKHPRWENRGGGGRTGVSTAWQSHASAAF